tara:strand:- start:29 stop:2326 length:2298 start_codon:yes stop_codon:yes gene_type:complete
MSSYDRNIERMRAAERSNAQKAMTQRTNMANIMGQRGIEEAERMSKSLSAFSSTLKKLRDQHIEEQFKIGFKEYKQYKKVNAEKYLELEKQINDAKGNQKLIEELRRKQIDLKGVNGYVDAERISHLSDYAQIGFVNAQLKSVIPTFEPKLQNAMQNSNKELIINGVKFKTKDIHNDNTDPLEFKRAGIEFHADSIWKNSGLDRYSPELLELAGVTEAFDKAKKSLNDKYTQRYNIEKGSQHREEAEQIFEDSKKTGDDIELLYKGVYSTFDGKGKLMTREGAWTVVDSKIISAALANNDEDVDDYITRILDQEIPERWAKQLGVEKGTTFAEHWPKKAQTLIAKAQKTRSDSLKAAIDAAKNDEQSILKKFLQQAADGEIKEKKDHPDDEEWSMEEYEAWYTSRGLDLPDRIKTHKTAFDKEVDKDKAEIELALLPENRYMITREWLASKSPYAKKGLESKIRQALEANEKDIMTDIAGMNAKDLINDLVDEVFEDMNIKGKEKDVADGYSQKLIKDAYLQKFYENLDQGMGRDQAAREALIGENGVLTDVKNNWNKSQYIKSPWDASEQNKYKPNQIEMGHVLEAKDELNKGVDWRKNVVGGTYAEKHLDTINENINKYGLWRGLYESEDAVSYYKKVTRGKHFANGGDFYTFIDAQIRAHIPGHPGFFGAEIDINNFNDSKMALNKANWDYQHGSLVDNEGFNAVWGDSLRTLQFNDIDHWLHAKMNIEDSFNTDSGFWSEYDNLSFITDYDLEYGELFLND